MVVSLFDLASKSKNGLKKLLILAREIKQRAIDRQKRLGRPPSLSEIPRLVRKLVDIYRSQPQQTFLLTPPPDFVLPEPIDRYEAWLEVNRWHKHSETVLRSRLKLRREALPKISILMPVYNPEIPFLEEAIASVVNQVYQNWELCIADDASTDSQVHLILKQWADKDQRIQVIFRPENGHISAATNTAATLATGDFLLFLDQDDLLTADALGEVALYLAANLETDFLYSDEDKIDSEGHRFNPFFKPDWSPELLLSYNYFNHLSVVRRSIFQHLGGLRIGFEGSQDYDFALRATEICRKVAHLPLVLYHWRTVPGSTAASDSNKSYCVAASQKAVQEALERRGIEGIAQQANWDLGSGLGYFEYQFPDTGPSVTIIIPTKNKLKLLRQCLSSLEQTSYENYRIVIIDNESDDPETLAYLQQVPHEVLRIKNPEGGFNFSAINNEAAKRVESDYLLFLNNDTEVISPQWLSQMVGYAGFQQVGAVGAKLLFPNKTIQHAGTIHGFGHGLPCHAFQFMPREDDGYFGFAKVGRNYSAVTAACLLTPRQLFLDLDGFDEKQFAVAYNDVDYCYRLVAKGYRCVYCPTAELIHKESCSRGYEDNPAEPAALRRKYAGKIDPMYSPHFSLLDGEQFVIQPRRLVLSELKPIKTLMCTVNLNWEEATKSQYELTVRLKEMGAIAPVVYSPEDGPLRENYQKAGIKVYIQDSPLQNVATKKDLEREINCFARWIEEQEVELIYANTLYTFYGVAAAQKLGLPSIWNAQESQPCPTYFDQLGVDFASPVLKCFSYPYRVIFVNDQTRKKQAKLNSHHNFTTILEDLFEEMVSSYAQIFREAYLSKDKHNIYSTIKNDCWAVPHPTG